MSTTYSQKCVGPISDRSLLQAYSATEPPRHPPPKVNASCTLRELTLSIDYRVMNITRQDLQSLSVALKI